MPLQEISSPPEVGEASAASDTVSQTMPFVSPEVFLKERVAAVQEYSLLTGRAVANIFTRPRYWDDIFSQMDSIGAGSMPIVILTGFFTGCVLALQAAPSLEEFGAVSMTGN